MITGKMIVVTGGSRGVGFGLVQQFLRRDNVVIATTRDTTRAHELQKLAETAGGKLIVHELDTSEVSSIKHWSNDLKEDVPHVDVLINNAGVFGRRLGFLELEAEDFLKTFTTNTVGPFLVSQELYRQGLLGGERGQSLVVNISSVMSSHGDQAKDNSGGGAYAYRASKAALNIINKAMATDLHQHGITSVLIHPGYVATDMTDYKGHISVQESTEGIMAVLESGKMLNDRFFSFRGEELPW
ncbi:hypothetical protein CEUSTIGMA_g2091.t1 [Chlamydomonas eustigma]|uniref:Uncharacterized protein n=1 Tax=Chlamydomonas eustigma TaxID=1157962 RepID=A0A250WUX4_9CHLO|nr:hypothetical protein CEUSTIGMA_g2091.t1 [Chlamydomonas eustigma]|eukprot:GAX74643.1 hypothetical protein CEUSTIGMA_g2091.t1 [Chlamydomonas eustigma]